MTIGGNLVEDAGTFQPSGIMLAAPASWVSALLERHHITSNSQSSGKLIVY